MQTLDHEQMTAASGGMSVPTQKEVTHLDVHPMVPEPRASHHMHVPVERWPASPVPWRT